MSEWVKRPYNKATDESALLYMWLRSYSHSRYGMRMGAHEPHSDAAREFWDTHRPVVLNLLDSSDVTVICDPDRAIATEDGAPVIWGWLCSTGDTVHYALVKRSVAQAGLAVDMLKDLLGDRLERPCGYTFEQVELRKHAVLPRGWYPDMTYFWRAAA